jgi:hypothetical protein
MAFLLSVTTGCKTIDGRFRQLCVDFFCIYISKEDARMLMLQIGHFRVMKCRKPCPWAFAQADDEMAHYIFSMRYFSQENSRVTLESKMEETGTLPVFLTG